MAEKSGFSAKRPSANGVEKSLKDLQEGTRRFNADFPLGLHKRLKTYSVEVDRDMTKIVMEWIEEKLDAHDKATGKAK